MALTFKTCVNNCSTIESANLVPASLHMATTLRSKIKRMSVDVVIQHNSFRTIVSSNKISNSIVITTGTCNNTQIAINILTRLNAAAFIKF